LSFKLEIGGAFQGVESRSGEFSTWVAAESHVWLLCGICRVSRRLSHRTDVFGATSFGGGDARVISRQRTGVTDPAVIVTDWVSETTRRSSSSTALIASTASVLSRFSQNTSTGPSASDHEKEEIAVKNFQKIFIN
jgi:hypothetical protein